MSILHTILLGIIEGITEFLPISSTAHLEIVQNLLKIPTTEFIKSFEIVIQLGAIGAVVLLYFRKIFSSFRYFLNICIAFIPTGSIGFVLYKIVKAFFLGNIILAACMLIIGGVIIILYERKHKSASVLSVPRTVESLTVKELISLGIIQALAVVPGVSRSGAVIIGGRMLGLSSPLITEFSFVLAVPTMLAAAGYDLLKSGFSFSGSEWMTIGVGFITSFIIALIVIKWLLSYIRTHSFSLFGWYRVVLGLILLIFLV